MVRKLTRSQIAYGECRKHLECRMNMLPNMDGHYYFKIDDDHFRIKFQKKTMKVQRRLGRGITLPHSWCKIRTVSYFEGVEHGLMDILKHRT